MKKITLPNIWPVACHTDNIGKNSVFIAIKGDNLDGARFISKAQKKGATKIVTENGRKQLSALSAKAWGNPAKKLKIIGVTGTKGKTTSVYALRHILHESGKKVAMITGVENMIGDQKFEANLTTPQPDYLHMFFAQCVNAGIEYVVMEVSAQALSLHRANDIEFAGMVFTNLEMEHSEFYENIDVYFAAKCRLLEFLKDDAFVVVNADDKWGSKVLERIDVAHPELVEGLITFGVEQGDCRLTIGSDGLVKLNFSLNDFEYGPINMAGKFNAYNLAGAALCAQQVGISNESIKKALSTFVSAPGRMEIYNLPNGARGVVDYAHTPASFRNILQLMRGQTKNLIVVFGAGGGKDHPKRPLMGEIATKFCDTVILTNDNPRNENPNDIVIDIIGEQLEENFLVEFDRAKAIKLAYGLSGDGSVIVLLGKGPDEYQVVGDNKFFFSDRQELLNQ